MSFECCFFLFIAQVAFFFSKAKTVCAILVGDIMKHICMKLFEIGLMVQEEKLVDQDLQSLLYNLCATL